MKCHRRLLLHGTFFFSQKRIGSRALLARFHLTITTDGKLVKRTPTLITFPNLFTYITVLRNPKPKTFFRHSHLRFPHSYSTVIMTTINIEYCGAWGYKPRSDKLSKTLVTTFKASFENKTLTITSGAGRTGSFEVTVTTAAGEATIVHSKLDGAGHINEESTRALLEFVAKSL